MKARCKRLCHYSLNMALAAVEIYNKPNFANREQVFSILIVNAWESLLKAKILKDNGNRITSLYIKDGRVYKRNNSGQHLTISIGTAIERCSLNEVAKENLQYLIDIRNAATHLTAQSSLLPILVFTLGIANLRNYAKLIREWFGVGLSDYNFHILPLGFSYPFKTITALDVKREPENIGLILKAIAQKQAKETEADGFFLICELHTTLVSAKKITTETDFTGKIEEGADAAIVVRKVKSIDLYPHSYTEVYQRLKKLIPGFKQNDLNWFIRDNKVKGDSRYSDYQYRSKSEELRGPNKNTPVTYNDNFIQLLLDFNKDR
jgi:hypothetical protein